jgi:hypothetical protein
VTITRPPRQVIFDMTAWSCDYTGGGGGGGAARVGGAAGRAG